MKRNRKKKENNLVPILVVGGAIALYFYLNRKRGIITVGPMSDPTWNAPEDYTPPGYEPYKANPFPSILDTQMSLPGGGSGGGGDRTIELNDRFDYYQEIQAETINGSRRRIRGIAQTC